MKKRIIAILLMFILCASFAGCLPNSKTPIEEEPQFVDLLDNQVFYIGTYKVENKKYEYVTHIDIVNSREDFEFNGTYSIMYKGDSITSNVNHKVLYSYMITDKNFVYKKTDTLDYSDLDYDTYSIVEITPPVTYLSTYYIAVNRDYLESFLNTIEGSRYFSAKADCCLNYTVVTTYNYLLTDVTKEVLIITTDDTRIENKGE